MRSAHIDNRSLIRAGAVVIIIILDGKVPYVMSAERSWLLYIETCSGLLNSYYIWNGRPTKNNVILR